MIFIAKKNSECRSSNENIVGLPSDVSIFFSFSFCSPCVKVNGSSLSGSKFSSTPRRVWFVGVTPDPSSSALVFFDSLIETPAGAQKK